MQITIQGPFLNKAELCAPVLHALPGWFGIAEANAQYLRDIDLLPTWLALRGAEVVGFLTVKKHFPQAAEIHVLGVCPDLHRQGIGRRLVAKVEGALSQQGIEYLQVKTLSASHPDEGYARTRAFYQALGFQPLEEFPDLWDPRTPCLQMIKRLAPVDPKPSDSQLSTYASLLAMILLLGVAFGLEWFLGNLRNQIRSTINTTPYILGTSLAILVLVSLLILFSWLIFIHWKRNIFRSVVFTLTGLGIVLYWPLFALFPGLFNGFINLGLRSLVNPLFWIEPQSFLVLAGVYVLIVGILDLVGAHFSALRVSRNQVEVSPVRDREDR